MRHLISRSGEGFVFDRAFDAPTEMLQVLSRNAHTLEELGPVEKLSRKEIVRLCQETHSVLVTADENVVPMLSSEIDAPWGLLLLPSAGDARSNVLRRLTADELVVRPSLPSRLDPPSIDAHRAAFSAVMPRSVSNAER